MIVRLSSSILIFSVRIYQLCLSPFLVSCCRFYPTCSDYAITAIKRHGPLKGLICAVKRIFHCHPFHSGGYDPV